jgi:hypothetical protein
MSEIRTRTALGLSKKYALSALTSIIVPTANDDAEFSTIKWHSFGLRLPE